MHTRVVSTCAIDVINARMFAGVVSKPSRQVQEAQEDNERVQHARLALLALPAHDVILLELAVSTGPGRVRSVAHDVTDATKLLFHAATVGAGVEWRL